MLRRIHLSSFISRLESNKEKKKKVLHLSKRPDKESHAGLLIFIDFWHVVEVIPSKTQGYLRRPFR